MATTTGKDVTSGSKGPESPPAGEGGNTAANKEVTKSKDDAEQASKAPETRSPNIVDSGVSEEERIDPKAPNDTKLALGGGMEVFTSSPLMKGIPVVVPISEALIKQGYSEKNLVEGVSLAAPVIDGAPEMLMQGQSQSVWTEAKKPGDVVGLHDVPGADEIQIDVVGKDGAVESQIHRADSKLRRKFEEAVAKDPAKGLGTFFKANFGDKTRVDQPE